MPDPENMEKKKELILDAWDEYCLRLALAKSLGTEPKDITNDMAMLRTGIVSPTMVWLMMRMYPVVPYCYLVDDRERDGEVLTRGSGGGRTIGQRVRSVDRISVEWESQSGHFCPTHSVNPFL